MRKHRQAHGATAHLEHARRVLAHRHAEMAKESAREVIAPAVAATRTVVSHANEAERMLSQVTRAYALNGSGVFADPALRRADLLGAREAIDQALAAMSAGKWPSDSDPRARRTSRGDRLPSTKYSRR